MKKYLTIIVAGVLAFNIFGFNIYFYFVEKQTNIIVDNKIEQQLYSDGETSIYKISASKLPYYTNSKQYELTSGEIEVNGQIKSYIKKRIYRDSIEYVLLDNPEKTKIRNAREEFFKLAYDFEKSTKENTKKATTSLKLFSFEAIENSSKLISFQKTHFDRNKWATSQALLPTVYLETICPPPNRLVS